MNHSFHPEAEAEFLEAINYYESRKKGLGYEFAFYLVVPIGPSYRVHSARYYIASLLSVGLLVPLAALGCWKLGSRRSCMTGMWILAAGAVATCLVFFPQERFRIPVLDPAMILLASGAFMNWPRDRVTEGAQRRVA